MKDYCDIINQSILLILAHKGWWIKVGNGHQMVSKINVISQIKLIEILKKYKFLKKYIHFTTPEVYGSTNKN